MNTPQRYDVFYGEAARPASDGDWVKYADYKCLQQVVSTLKGVEEKLNLLLAKDEAMADAIDAISRL